MPVKLTIEEMKQIAESRGGKCLSEEYKNSKAKLLWECKEGHRWETTASNVKHRHNWCPRCMFDRKRLSILHAKNLAEKRNGRCLSEEYINSSTKLLWECEKGHQWEADYDHVSMGTWCPTCRGRNKTIKDMQELADSKSGKCLSNKYINDRTKLKWQCEKGHIWEAMPNSIVAGRWCNVCASHIRNLRYTIGDMQKLAQKRGGKCLSNEYISVNKKLLWECSEGHQWYAVPSSIKNLNTWCPECNNTLGENIARAYFEQLFNKEFPKSYPNWLKNSEGNQLELDGYCEELKLAFEHQGEFHYKYIHRYNKNIMVFNKRQYHDKLKKYLCEQNNILLIQIPEIPSLLKIKNIKNFILKECIDNNFYVPENFNKIKINLDRVYLSNTDKYFSELKNLVFKKKGKCLSKVYLGCDVKLEFQCDKNHIWEATPDKIKQNRWCPICSKESKKTKFLLFSPENKEYNISGYEKLKKFCKEKDIFYTVLFSMANNRRENNYKGWRVYKGENK